MQKTRKCRIHKACGRIKYAGTGIDSWMNLETARKLVDYDKGESIHEYQNHSTEPIWEIF